jgi:hypothetical protein
MIGTSGAMRVAQEGKPPAKLPPDYGVTASIDKRCDRRRRSK